MPDVHAAVDLQALRCYGHDSDKAWRFLKMALDRAKTESMASSQFLSDLLSELNRVNGTACVLALPLPLHMQRKRFKRLPVRCYRAVLLN